MKWKAYPKYKNSGMEWLGEVPKHWEIKQFKRVTTRVDVGIAEAATHAYVDEGIPIIRSTNVRPDKIFIDDLLYIQEWFAEKNKSKYLFADDLVTVRTGAPGTTAVVPQELHGCQCFTMLISTLKLGHVPQFYSYFLNSSNAKFRFAVEGWGTAQINISVPILQQQIIAQPPENEQIAITKFLDRETSRIDTLIAKKERQIELLQEKRTALIHDAECDPSTRIIRIGHVVDQILRPINRRDDDIYIPVGLYNRGRGIFHKEPTIGADLGDSNFFWIKKDDLILSGQFAWEGAVALAGENDANCVATHRYPILRGRSNLMETAYMFAFFTTKTGDFLLNEHSRGAAGRNRPLNIGSLLKESIPVPPMKAQAQVSSHVYFERRIEMIVARSVKLLKEYRTAIISAGVTGRIDIRKEVT